MKIFKICLLIICALVFSANLNVLSAQVKDSVAFRIKQVENSLSPLVRIEGEPLWNLEGRMQKHNVVGLSIAVVNNFKVEWAKGYGIKDRNTEAKVSTETIFQAASMGI